MVDLDTVKMKLSQKDVLLLIGILVAMIITLTTVVYKDNGKESKQTTLPAKTSVNAVRSDFLKKFLKSTELVPVRR